MPLPQRLHAWGAQSREFIAWVRSERLAKWTIGLSAAVLLAFVLLILTMSKVANQAQAGDAARTRQIQVGPTICAIVIDNYQRGVITYRELQGYAKNAPADTCVIPPR